MNSSTSAGTLIDDIRAEVVAYLEPRRGCSALALSSSMWYETIRYSPSYQMLLKDRCPSRYPEVETEYFAQGQPLDFEWRAALARICQTKLLTNYAAAAAAPTRSVSRFFSKITSSLGEMWRSMFFWSASKSNDRRIMMIGLDAAGKTTLLYQLKLNEKVDTIPTIGFNVEQISVGRITLTCWDAGGQPKLRPLVRQFMNNTNGVIFVIDSTDHNRLRNPELEDGCVFSEFTRLQREHELKNCPFLFFANKQDCELALSIDQIAHTLELKTFDNKWAIYPCVATTGAGLDEGLQWLARVLDP